MPDHKTLHKVIMFSPAGDYKILKEDKYGPCTRFVESLEKKGLSTKFLVVTSLSPEKAKQKYWTIKMGRK